MKSLITILIFLLAGITLHAQQTKKVFIVVQSEDSFVAKTENGKQVWRDDIIYKKYLKIITTPFDMPMKVSSSMERGLSNQFAEFIYKNRLKEFEKLKRHLRGFAFTVLDYNTNNYDVETKDCKGCNYQYEKTILDGFVFKPVEASTQSPYYMKMHEFITGKKTF